MFAVTFGMLALLVRVLRSIDRAGSHDDADSDSGGGGGARRPTPPLDPGGEPAWWPEFERRLAEYVRQRAGAR